MKGVGFSTGLVMALGFGTVYGDADATGEASALTTTQTVGRVLDVVEDSLMSDPHGQFVGGDTAQETIPLLKQLRTANTGALLAYSVEVDEDEAAGTKEFKRDDVKAPHK
ncbi:hypothetical protein ONZ45_g13084 [Pleurotus djamor]|nr:hypothetical protein ONZ45_g13084 [Pleurotus djamor]